MVIDTSVLYAILTDEPEAPAFEAAVEADPTRLLSTGTFLEISVVVVPYSSVRSPTFTHALPK